VPARTGIGVAVIVFYGVLWAEGANDVLADRFQIPLYAVTWIARALVIAGPVAAYVITRRTCLGLQRKDALMLEHGVETRPARRGCQRRATAGRRGHDRKAQGGYERHVHRVRHRRGRGQRPFGGERAPGRGRPLGGRR
jgi:hypothetical protein